MVPGHLRRCTGHAQLERPAKAVAGPGRGTSYSLLALIAGPGDRRKLEQGTQGAPRQCAGG